MLKKPEIPSGWRELQKHEIISTDDKIWSWGAGPWEYVGGSSIGERYNRPCAGVQSHWTIIRETRAAREGAPMRHMALATEMGHG